ncbi:MAG: EscU/YscU/HrcU family type III secretion system export apparatus switch protein [Anaerovoracaceae bacterium]
MLKSDRPGTPGNRLHAAALKYEKDRDDAPKVVAAGSGETARRIIEVAMENGVAIYHDDSAATLLAKLDVGRDIPPELYKIVVDIYLALLELAAARQGESND